MFSSIWSWVQANPVLIVPIVGALASLVYNKLDSYPRIHAFFSALAALGIDLPKLLAMLQKMVTGKDPRPPPPGMVALSSVAPTVPPAPRPPSVQRDWTAALLAVAIMGVVLSLVGAFTTGCALLKGSTLPSDLEQNFVCVEGEIASGDTNVMAIEKKCLPGQLGTIVDMIETLIASPQFAADHAAQVPALREGVVGARASMARDK